MTDYSNASRTMLFNINTLDWDEDILEELNIPKMYAARSRCRQAVYTASTDPAYFGGTDSHRWSGRRPAGCIVRTDLFYTREMQKTPMEPVVSC